MLLTNGKKRIPIGYEDFKQLIDSGFYYVDKSMLIYELLHSGGQNNLITRPRRFGKTLNFSMLKYFFDINEKDNAYLFDGLKISEHYEELAMYRNTHPVITLSLKCAKQGDYDKAIYSLRNEIQYQFKKYSDVLKSEKIDVNDRKRVEEIMATDAPDTVLGDSIKLLCLCLKQYYGVNTIILIDEYDVPLEDAYFSGYYDKMVQFIRSLFESALKTNPALEFSVMTGCLRISKESIFTGLNNQKTLTITNAQFDEYFGFTDKEVKEMLAYYDLEEHYETMKEWYDGYRFGKTDVYCPWDVINFCDDLRADEDAYPQNYWSNTSGNAIVRRLIDKADSVTKNEVESLIAGDEVIKEIHQELTYSELDQSIENLWSVLFTTGYLTQRGRVDGRKYRLAIPNREIRELFITQIREWFRKSSRKDTGTLEAFCQAFPQKDAVKIEKLLNEYLWNTISIRDTSGREKKENFYHGMILGLLRYKENWLVKSNAESGEGYSDILIEVPESRTGIVVEIKYAEDAAFDSACNKAIQQIEEKHYEAALLGDGMENVVKYGIACYKKRCKVLLAE